MESGTANLLHILEERVKELCYQEKWDEAVHAAETAVRKAREVGEAEPDVVAELALSLEVKGDLLRQIRKTDESLRDYTEALDLLDGREKFNEQIARISASVAVICDEQGDSEAAKAHYRRSIEIFEGMDPPAELDVADLSNNLAFLYEAEGEFDIAETLLLRALQICPRGARKGECRDCFDLQQPGNSLSEDQALRASHGDASHGAGSAGFPVRREPSGHRAVAREPGGGPGRNAKTTKRRRSTLRRRF